MLSVLVLAEPLPAGHKRGGNGEAGRLFGMVGPTTHDASEVAKEGFLTFIGRNPLKTLDSKK
jgi:hypothetical protein